MVHLHVTKWFYNSKLHQTLAPTTLMTLIFAIAGSIAGSKVTKILWHSQSDKNINIYKISSLYT